MKQRQFIIPALVAVGLFTLVGWVASSSIDPKLPPAVAELDTEFDAAVLAANERLESNWKAVGAIPAKADDDLRVLRRLSLVLHGTIPSLEEIRKFERDDKSNRLRRWTTEKLEDPRFHRYFAERLARSLVGTQKVPFLIYRRDRFIQWMTDQIRDRRPYNEIVRDIIAEKGLWTGEPATNFMTSAMVDGDLDENRLTGRVTRTFLGQRMDCAQCHNDRRDEHNKTMWQQDHFEGMAAFFGQTKVTMVGVEDKQKSNGEPVEYEIKDDPAAQTGRVVPPSVPFGVEWLGETGSRRERLAAWVTHPDNRRFERAIANRVWGLMFGMPFERINSADDMFDPPEDRDPAESEDLLDILGRDFREHGYDLRRLVQVIAETRSFRMESKHPLEAEYEAIEQQISDLGDGDPAKSDAQTSRRDDIQIRFNNHIDHWAVFPFARLRPEQVIGSMLQAASIKTIDQDSNLIIRFLRLIREGKFIEDYGDLGEAELEQRAGTIPQALLRMNGELSRETSEVGLLTASGRIDDLSSSNEKRIECCYLVCFARLPTDEEREHLLSLLDGKNKNQRKRVIEDIFWSLFNSPEFSWLN